MEPLQHILGICFIWYELEYCELEYQLKYHKIVKMQI